MGKPMKDPGVDQLLADLAARCMEHGIDWNENVRAALGVYCEMARGICAAAADQGILDYEHLFKVLGGVVAIVADEYGPP